MSNDKSRKPKKSETLEVRIPYETKQAFLTACREDGTTASEVVRGSVQSFLDTREQPHPQWTRTLIMKFPQPVRRYGPRIAAGALAAVGLATFAVLPSAAAPDFAAIFKQLDVNGDGMLTSREFSASQPGAKTMAVRTLGADKAVEQGAAAILIVPPDVDGKALAALRDVRFQAVGGSPAENIDAPRERGFAKFDADSDGQISLEEYQTRLKTLLANGFHRLDENSDGAVTAAEYAAIGQAVLLTPVNSEPAFGVSGKYGALAMPELIDAQFAKLDANRDGELSLDEYLSPD